MTGWAEEEDESGEELPDEVEVPSADRDDDGFDDIPSTHMGDEEYETFVAGEIDSRGRVKGDPPVTAILVGVTLAILIVCVLVYFLR